MAKSKSYSTTGKLYCIGLLALKSLAFSDIMTRQQFGQF